MSAATQLPTWAVYVGGIGSPLAAFLAVLFGNWVNRRGQTELETRSKREETMRVLRWAAELAVSVDESEASLGVSQLRALGGSDLLDAAQQLFVDAALEAVVDGAADEVDEAGEDAEVLHLAGSHLPSEADDESEDDSRG